MSRLAPVPGLAINALLDAARHGTADVDGFLAGRDVPIVEDRYCTFLYRGPAEDVRLRHWIFGLPTAQPFQRIPGTDLWFYVLELPRGSRVEYKLEVTENGQTQLVRDPLNPRLAHDPFGANSVCQATGYEVPEWTLPDPGAPEGALDERMFRSQALGGERRVTLYYPARYRRTRRYPLLVVHDGSDYVRFAAFKTILDNLIHRLEIPGVVVALTDPGDRMAEYRSNEAHARFVAEELVPSLEHELPLLGTPEGRGLMGASLGAVAALSTAHAYPGMFSRLLLQSGSFAFSDIGEHERGPVFDPIADFVNQFRADPQAVAERLYVTCGIYESLIYENRSLVPVLQGTGMDVRYVEARDGHNWENWRDRLREGLSVLFPGPLWLVYE
ncbi:MAG: alpha/beta hydrolase-fold protein [Gemmatimonadota bacterium]|nr:enterochelin esterase [Gemmatimonadota bacterium]